MAIALDDWDALDWDTLDWWKAVEGEVIHTKTDETTIDAKHKNCAVDEPKWCFSFARKTACHRTCPICCEADVDVLVPEDYAGPFQSACSCAACATCIARWVESQIPACRRQFQLRVPCFGCPKVLPQKLVLVTPAADILAAQLERREILQCNRLFPEPLQVECRRHDCVGIGYLGHETVMCMICEEQWRADADDGADGGVSHAGAAIGLEEVQQYEKLDAGELACVNVVAADGATKTVQMRRCPKCKVITEKNGGCDHMVCKLCRHEYYWTTGKNYRT